MAIRRRRVTRLLVTAALAVGGLAALPAQQAAAADTGVPNGDVIANLWEWNWKSVASECTNVLDPAGYGAVQVAPPAESLKQTNYYWRDVYQPYSYNINHSALERRACTAGITGGDAALASSPTLLFRGWSWGR
ncbi:hypothetical protein [Streptomyces sp. NPDC050564]|uniref:hypothetical protein n=1 Tax=Streptomyces sp. NPDC050564 TaxID=3365631 RepID=UPI0037B7BA8B